MAAALRVLQCEIAELRTIIDTLSSQVSRLEIGQRHGRSSPVPIATRRPPLAQPRVSIIPAPTRAIVGPSRRQPPPLPPPHGFRFRETLPIAAPPKNIVVLFDLETGGLGKTSEIRVCQIAATAVDEEFNVLGRFGRFCNPLSKMDEGAIATHGFSDEFVASFDDWATVGNEFNNFMSQMRSNNEEVPITLCAHNGKRFDMRIVVFEHARHHIQWPRNVNHSDSIETFKQLYPGLKSYSMAALHNHVFNMDVPNAHDASADVDAMYALLTDRYEEKRRAFATLLENSESVAHVIKRAFKDKR
jgi:DNA polymerase III epsilon subunit-like protein